MFLRPADIRPLVERRQQGADRRIGARGCLQGMASLAGTKPRLDAFADRRAEGAIARQRLAGRAGQAAEDAGGGDTDIGLAVIALIAGNKRLIEGVVVWKGKQHDILIALRQLAFGRKSGVYSKYATN